MPYTADAAESVRAPLSGLQWRRQSRAGGPGQFPCRYSLTGAWIAIPVRNLRSLTGGWDRRK